MHQNNCPGCPWFLPQVAFLYMVWGTWGSLKHELGFIFKFYLAHMRYQMLAILNYRGFNDTAVITCENDGMNEPFTTES